MKKHDPLEDFIRDNKASFDDLKAPHGVWERIDKKDRPTLHLWKWTAVAASALLLVAVGYIFGMKTQSKPEIAGWDEYLETEKYYQARIDRNMEKIKTLPVGNEVMTDIQALDEVYQQLRKQLLEDPNADTQLLLSAMIKHQQQKLQIMEKIVDRVSKYKKNENDNHEI
jgi:hypothetical protein